MTRQSAVVLLEEIKVHVLVDEHPHANIEFSFIDKQRALNVFLNNEPLHSGTILHRTINWT